MLDTKNKESMTWFMHPLGALKSIKKSLVRFIEGHYLKSREIKKKNKLFIRDLFLMMFRTSVTPERAPTVFTFCLSHIHSDICNRAFAKLELFVKKIRIKMCRIKYLPNFSSLLKYLIASLQLSFWVGFGFLFLGLLKSFHSLYVYFS